MSFSVRQEVMNVDNDVGDVCRMPSINLWKLAGQSRSPIGEVIQWYWPLPAMVKALSGCDFLSSCICQKPDVKSKVEKIVEFARPMSPKLCYFLH
jgi:hypothetical protein